MKQRRQGKGVVYLVGAGPSDAELITVKGKRLLEEADVTGLWEAVSFHMEITKRNI